MATLSKIRSHGPLLVGIIAVALFCFVAGDLFKGCEGLVNQSKQQVGEIQGEALSIQDYNELVNDLTNYYEIVGQQSSGEDVQNRIKDEVWQTYVQNKLIQDECEKLGIQVTDDEVAQILQSGANRMLQIPAFMGQDGKYDFAAVQQFLTSYQSMKDANQEIPDVYQKIYKYYLFAQRTIRDDLYTQKYQVLMSKALTANSVEAKMNFDAQNQQYEVLVAAVPFSSIDDKDIEVSDAELKAKYDERKEAYKQSVETRNVKYISVAIVPSDKDKEATLSSVKDYQAKLEEATDNESAGNVVRQSASLIAYSNILKSKDAFPAMIADALDSTAVGQTVPAAFDIATNCYFTFKVLDKTQQPDSVLLRQIGVGAEDVAKTQEKADSILNAINAGGDFKAIAKNYGQEGDSAWISTADYERGNVDADYALFISSIYNTAVGTAQQVKLSNGNIIIIQVLDTKNPITKYNVASIVKENRFTDETYNNEYNKFSSFLAANKTLESIEANAAKEGYQVLESTDLVSSAHGVANIHSTHDALKWAFDEAEVGEVSPLYECGDNDHLLVVALTDVNPKGYRSVEKLNEILKQQVLADKKAEKILAQLKDAKSLSAVKTLKDASVDTLHTVTFASAPYVMTTSSQEPIVCALAAKTAKGQVSAAAKGLNGVFMVQVLDKKNAGMKFDAKAEKTNVSNTLMRFAINNVINTLYLKADVTDSRYKFF
ncbi:MAG: SurA N-terminal domain-containing protein [Bacteroidaceae bacterium]|nr:SurA N-terminal domain-containing protein [Bacteroidaceae bacterium]